MPIGFIVQGSKEKIRCPVTDMDETVTDLSTSTPTFSVYEHPSDTPKVTDVAATAAGMIISCLLDTTSGGTWAEGEYKLVVKFTVGSEVIRKGPFYFTVIL